MKTHFLLPLWVGLSFSAGVHAQNSPEAIERSLKIIRDFAISMCANPEYRGNTSSVGASATAKADVSNLLKKLIDARVELDAGAKREGFEGMLQKDLLEATKVASECRLKIFNDLKGRLLSNAPPAMAEPLAPKPVATPVSPSFDCVRASNRVERLICASPRIAILDLSMANGYRDLMSEQRTGVERQGLKDSQNHWLRKVRDVCPDEDCLDATYKQRIEQFAQSRR